MTKVSSEIVCKNVTAQMGTVVQRPDNASALWDGKDIIVIGRVTKEHLVKTAKRNVIVRIMVRVILKRVNVHAAPAGRVKIVKRNANSDTSVSIANRNVIVISTIPSHVIPLMDIASANIHGLVSISNLTHKT